MPRPHKCRRVAYEPALTVFKPAGVAARTLESVELRLDEVEALRLADVEGLYHDAAAQRMGISRATFGRLIEGARRKVASALIESKMLLLKGGNVTMAETRAFECRECGHCFECPYGTGRPQECPSCRSPNVQRAPEDRGRGRRSRRGQHAGGVADSGGHGRGRCRRLSGASGRSQETSPAVEQTEKT